MEEESKYGWVEKALDRRCERLWWPIGIFLLATTAGLFNAMHITVYVFIADTPSHTCAIPQLLSAKWTFEQIASISSPNTDGKGCSMYLWDYSALAKLGYNASVSYVREKEKPSTIPCESYIYDSHGSSVVTEWDLVCDRSFLKSSVQVSASVGKFIGAFMFGPLADRFGRKKCFTIASLIYILSGPLAGMVTSFTIFQFLRLLIGIAGSGVYETGYTLLSELTGSKWRTRLSCIFAIFYPVGYVLLAGIAACFSTSWRAIQLLISLPMLLLLINCWLLPESPRWLLIHGRKEEAQKILDCSHTSMELEIDGTSKLVTKPNEEKQEPDAQVTKNDNIWYKKVINIVKVSSRIFTMSEMRNRAFICFFSWCIGSLAYYVIALNANNLSASRYVYIALNGLVEAPGYVIPIIVLMYIGRKSASIFAFLGCGIALVSIILLPRDADVAVVFAAMIGRFCASGIFSIVSLHTSELFPTTYRNTALGLSLAMSQVGSICAPYVVDIFGEYAWYAPSTVCGLLSVCAAVLLLMLPETKGKPLPDTDQELTIHTQPVSIKNCCSF